MVQSWPACEKIAEVVGKRVKLEATALAAKERHDSYSRVLLTAPLPSAYAVVVESNGVLGGAAHAGHDEADARIEFAGMAFDPRLRGGRLLAITGRGLVQLPAW